MLHSQDQQRINLKTYWVVASKTLVNENQSSGHNSIIWNATNDRLIGLEKL